MTAQTRQMAHAAFPWTDRYVKDGELRQIVKLTPQKAHRLEHKPQIITVIQGCAWLALDGEDYFINPGQDVMVPVRNEPVVISSPNGKPVIFEVR